MNDKKHFLKINDNEVITYTVVRSKRKTLGIAIDNQGQVKVSAPLLLKDKQIKAIIEKKTPWIRNKLKDLKEKVTPSISRQFVRGDKFFYLGKI